MILQILQTARTMVRDGSTDAEVVERYPEIANRIASIHENLAEDITLEMMGTKRFDTPLSKTQSVNLLRKLKENK